MKVTHSIFNAFCLLSKIINPILKALSKSKFKSHKNNNPLLHMSASGDLFQFILFVLQTVLIDK
ncbi:hypothetical protein COJ18_12275 [Bacillus cereus]|nr:hypothetical protein COJ18_12275 [Bacillus cereus]PFM98430.1 hypothetical protein COJ65_23085 [Bacillus cereus]